MSEHSDPARPDPAPWGAAIAAACRQAGLSGRAAARQAGISEGWWRQVASGYQVVSPGVYAPVRGPAHTVAAMAAVAGLTPAQLRAAGRDDAARLLAARAGGSASTSGGSTAGESMTGAITVGGSTADASMTGAIMTGRGTAGGSTAGGDWAGRDWTGRGGDERGRHDAGRHDAGPDDGSRGNIDELLLRIRSMDGDKARELLARITAALFDSVAGEAGAGPGSAQDDGLADEPGYGTLEHRPGTSGRRNGRSRPKGEGTPGRNGHGGQVRDLSWAR